MDYWAEAHQALNYAMKCPGAPGNAYLWLRLGDTYRHLNQPDNALEAYTSAYMLDGEDVFEDEPDAWDTLKHAGIPTT